MAAVLPPTPPPTHDFGDLLHLQSPTKYKGPVYWQRFQPLPLQSFVQVPPSIWTPACHPRVVEVSEQVNGWFLAHWDFPNDKARARFVAAGFPRVTCLYYPLAKDDRIHFACELLTILFLIDDLLEHMSFAEGKAYNDKLMAIAENKEVPDASVPAQWMFGDLWNRMRECDLALATEILEPTFVFMRAQTDPTRRDIRELGQYLEYREKDVGKALLSALMRFSMNVSLTSEELATMKNIENNCAKHISIVNDIYSWEKELKQSLESDGEGSLLCSAVKVLADNAGLDVNASKRSLWIMVREWELKHEKLCSEPALSISSCSEGAMLYLKGLEYQMSGNELWSKTTPRYLNVDESVSDIQTKTTMPGTVAPVVSSSRKTLGLLDDIMPDIDLCMIICLRCDDDDQESAQSALRASFVTFMDLNPWLNAVIVPSTINDHRKGTKLVEYRKSSIDSLIEVVNGRHLTSIAGQTYAELYREGMPNSKLPTRDMIPPRSYNEMGTKLNVALKARLTFISGGCFVALNTSHALMDATGLAKLLSTWAALNCEHPQVSSLRHGPITLDHVDDRGIAYKELKQDALLWHTLGLDYRPSTMSSAHLARNLNIGPSITKILSIGESQLLTLKATCNAARSTTMISTNSAVCALLWRCIVRARLPKSSLEARTSLMSAVNIRSRLKVPVVDTDISNAILYSINNDHVGSLIASGSENLALTAAQVSRAIAELREDPARVHRTLALAARIPDVSTLGLVYPTWLRDDVVISSLMHLPIYQQSWGDAYFGRGDGRPDFVRFPHGTFDGIVFIMPRSRNGSVEISVTMEADTWASLEDDSELQEYASVLADPGLTV